MENQAVVMVRNNGKRLALVGGAYLYPGETRQCTRRAYEASKRAGNEVVLVLEENAPLQAPEVNVPEPPVSANEQEMDAPKAQRKNTRARS